MIKINNNAVREELMDEFLREFDGTPDFLEKESKIKEDNRTGRCGHSVNKYFKKRNGEIARQKEMKTLSQGRIKKSLFK